MSYPTGGPVGTAETQPLNRGYDDTGSQPVFGTNQPLFFYTALKV